MKYCQGSIYKHLYKGLFLYCLIFPAIAKQSASSVDARVEPNIDIYVHSESISIESSADGEHYRGEFSLDLVTNVASVLFGLEATYLYKDNAPSSQHYLPIDTKTPVELFTVNAAEGQELKLFFSGAPISRADGFKSMRTRDQDLSAKDRSGTYQDTLSFSVTWKTPPRTVLPHGRYNGVVYINIMTLE